MATAYLLASVLTLIVVLVRGQEALPEQGNLVVVAEDSFEDELNSFTNLILPGSANTRAECIQKKKCKNKGGTCQNKGNTCPGKFVKGCSKGCSCCLLEEISCKLSKRCKRANGACIARGECNGKIISSGCKKPKSCKKTHVCCVQDGSTTQVPACSGGSRCITTGNCPDNPFKTSYVCKTCKNWVNAISHMDKLNQIGIDNPHLVFAGRTYADTPISYESINTQKCEIKERVQTWLCNLNSDGSWSCSIHGFCTADIEKIGNVYKPNRLNCGCPSPKLFRENICKGCDSNDKALTFVKGLPANMPPNILFHPVFGNKDNNREKIKINPSNNNNNLCIIENPVATSICKRVDKNWTCDMQGFCTSKSELGDGTINPDSIDCKCPNGNFINKHVCKGCDSRGLAVEFLKVVQPEPVYSYTVVGDKEYRGKIITFSTSDDKKLCIIKKPVQIWICKPKEGKWDPEGCKLQGYCTAESDFITGAYKEGSIKCNCPDPVFIEKHVCKDCDTGIKALEYTKKRQKGDGPNTVLYVNQEILYKLTEYNEQKTCKVNHPVSVKGWDVMRNVKKEWYLWQDLGQCINLQSALNNGHLFFEIKKCYKQTSNIWGDDQCDTVGEVFISKDYEKCMVECESRPGCTAINYKVGKECTMKNCRVPVPTPNKDTTGFVGYYLNTGYKQTSNIWGDDQCDTVGAVLESTYYEKCMVECKSRPGCTAINYEVGKECTMKNCRVPVPTPNKDTTGFVGYYLFDIGPSTEI